MAGGADAEVRVDPADGLPRSFKELQRLCGSKYTNAELHRYWERECKVLESHIHDGTLCAVTDATVAFASTTSWERIGAIAAGRLLVAQGPPQQVQAYVMVPIRPRGAVEVSHLRPVPLGTRVVVRGEEHLGFVRFFGAARFAEGLWVGVECDEAVGRHDGTVEGVTYFTCPTNRGIFVKPRKLCLAEAAVSASAGGGETPPHCTPRSASPGSPPAQPQPEATAGLLAELAAAKQAAARAEGELAGQRRFAEAAVREFHDKWCRENATVLELRAALAEERRRGEELRREVEELRRLKGMPPTASCFHKGAKGGSPPKGVEGPWDPGLDSTRDTATSGGPAGEASGDDGDEEFVA